MRTSTKRFLCGAGLVALMFGGAAPLAHADETGDIDHCTSEGSTDQKQGAAWVLSANSGSTGGVVYECAYVSTGGAQDYTAETLNAWEIEVKRGGVVVSTTKHENAFQGSGNLIDRGTISDVAAGDVVTIRIASECDEGSGACGASIGIGIGAS